MSELQFPKNPTVGQEYDFAPYKYYWDGVKWKTKGIGYNPVNDLKDAITELGGELDPTVKWAAVPAHSNAEIGGPLNAQAEALAARTKMLRTEVSEALRRSYAEAGYTLVTGSFEVGGTVTTATDVLLYEAEGKAYTWGGTLPKVVTAGSTPVSAGGIGAAKWTSRAISSLRNSLNDPASGDALISVQQPFAGAVARTQHSKNAECITPMDFGAVGNGVVNDQAAFTAMEATAQAEAINLLGKTYLIDTLPTINRYINGRLKHSADGYIYDANPSDLYNVGNRNVLLAGAGAAMPKWVKHKGPLLAYNVFGIGFEALHNNINGRNLTALGSGALHEMQNGRYNIAIGLESQYYCNSDDGASVNGTRNTSIGDNSLRFNVTGYSNCAMGRNTGQNIVNVDFNTAIGAAAMSGYSPLGLDGVTIENQSPITAGEQTHIGTNAGYWSNSVGNTSLGSDAASNIKTGQIIAIGHMAGKNVEVDRHYDGKQKLFVSLAGTFSWTGTVITCSVSAHGLATGFLVKISVGGREANYLPVTVVDANKFTIATPYTNTETGSVSISEVVTNTLPTPVSGVLAIGRRAMTNANNCSNSVAIGEASQFQSTGTNNTSIGGLTMNANTTGSFGVAVGYSALRFNTTGAMNVAVGEFSASNNTTGSRITAIGRNALRNNQSGTAMDGFDNVTGVGADSRVSGSNQVQLGDPGTTTYVYGTVQNRSDMRDKTDTRDTVLGIEFIMGLRPVDGRWDMREDYWEEYDEQVGVDAEGLPVFETKRRQLPNDGSKARARFHHWFIAQEVKELCDKLGVDFGGYQDHSVNGGCDVMSLGYDEFIPPTVKAVQQCWTRLDELEARLAKLEGAA